MKHGVIPHSIESEKGVLGSVLLMPSCMDNLSISPEHFYDRRNSRLWEGLMEMRESNKVMDAVTIGEWLKSSGALEAIGGYDYLVELQDETLVPGHSGHYVDAVKKAYNERRRIEVLEDALGAAYRGEDGLEDALSALNCIDVGRDEEIELHQMGEEFISACKEGNVGHFEWWCNEWTAKLGKMSSDLMIFHAPRSTGKTAMMLQWMTECHKSGGRAPLASIEMLKKELVPRFLAHLGQVSTFTMRTRGSVTCDEEAKAKKANEDLRALSFCIRDKGMTIRDIVNWADAENRKKKVDVIFIDNLLSISDGGKSYQSKTIMYDYFIRKLRDLRDLLKVPIIILAHPNADGGVAWSKDCENFADIILYMAEVYEEGVNVNGKQISHIPMRGKHILARLQKNRQGIQPWASLEFIGATQTFRHVQWELE